MTRRATQRSREVIDLFDANGSKRRKQLMLERTAGRKFHFRGNPRVSLAACLEQLFALDQLLVNEGDS